MQDINNVAYGLMLSSAREEVMLPLIDKNINKIRELAHEVSSSTHSTIHGATLSTTRRTTLSSHAARAWSSGAAHRSGERVAASCC